MSRCEGEVMGEMRGAVFCVRGERHNFSQGPHILPDRPFHKKSMKVKR
jgi:hypothetical protein